MLLLTSLLAVLEHITGWVGYIFQNFFLSLTSRLTLHHVKAYTLFLPSIIYCVFSSRKNVCYLKQTVCIIWLIRDPLISKTELGVVFLEFLIRESLLWLIKWQIVYYSVLQSHTVAFLKIIIFQNPTKPNQLKLFPRNLNFILCYLFLFISK